MEMVAKPVKASQVVMTELVLPSHTNSLGSIFGGVIMSWIDIAGAICAQRHAKNTVVTASLDELSFIDPVYLGWVVNLKASINYVSKTSMEVGVRVDAENPRTGEVFHTASAYLTFVALNDAGKPTLVPAVECESSDEKRRHQEALARRSLRLQRKPRSKQLSQNETV